jgi:hypothetical protein
MREQVIANWSAREEMTAVVLFLASSAAVMATATVRGRMTVDSHSKLKDDPEKFPKKN